jgi:hypothetical protein
MSEVRLPIELGALRDVPLYHDHKRARNWCAIVRLDPKAPGGLARQFLGRARGSGNYYLADGLAVGQVVEFGADYYSGSGRKSADRWYGVVRDISESEVVIESFPDARAAVRAEPPAPDSSDTVTVTLSQREVDALLAGLGGILGVIADAESDKLGPAGYLGDQREMYTRGEAHAGLTSDEAEALFERLQKERR